MFRKSWIQSNNFCILEKYWKSREDEYKYCQASLMSDELKYQKGKVIALGIYADDIITNKKFECRYSCSPISFKYEFLVNIDVSLINPFLVIVNNFICN
jgi:hypothetical protein